MSKFTKILKDKYGIHPSEVMETQGGWAALAFEVSGGENHYFLKVYEKHRASTSKLTALIDQYSPILVWLETNTDLKGRIPVPLLTKDGHYKCEDDVNIYLLYPFIHGDTVGGSELSNQQVKEFAHMIATLHSYGEEIPVPTKVLVEQFDVPFLEQLESVLSKEEEKLPEELRELINTYKDNVVQSIKEIRILSTQLKSSTLDMVLCHTDLHHWNLMQSTSLVLIDWEGLKIAPVEADMMFLVDKPYFDEFFKIYKEVHKDYSINEQALRFYSIKRKLEDTWNLSSSCYLKNLIRIEKKRLLLI
ncbi:phosphotransferase [Bacillus sp. JCM 19041]|uniref:phosphotransferase n=1 Tax=Bacillus sp. JCM 19041 TaxID=1460637 RepID=UPI000AAAACC9